MMAKDSTDTSQLPQAIIVSVQIKEDRIDDFKAVMATNSENSRKEAGCLRFDTLQDNEDATKFVFYEVYADAAGMAAHKETDHYKGWASFKESGGVVSQSV